MRQTHSHWSQVVQLHCLAKHGSLRLGADGGWRRQREGLPLLWLILIDRRDAVARMEGIDGLHSVGSL